MTTIQITGTGTATGTRIHNPRTLVAARLAWLVVFGVSLTMFILSIPYHFSEMHTLCTSGPCYAPALTPDILQRLQQAGLSPDFYAGYWAFLEFLIAGPFALTSLILFSRRSDDRMALFAAIWMASAPGGISITVASFAVQQTIWQIPEAILRLIFGSSIVLFLYLFPDGRFVPRWTRWLSLPVFLIIVSAILVPGAPLNPEHTMLSILAQPKASALIYIPVVIALIFFGVIFQVYRYRRLSTPAQRQQTKLVVLGLAISFAGWIIIGPLSLSLLQSATANFIVVLIGLTAAVCFLELGPVAVGFSALHYRLWDVDLMVNKSLVYGGLSALLALFFIADVLVFQRIVESVTGSPESPLALGVYAVVVGVTFQPIRRIMQRAVDRHLFRLNIGLDQLERPKVVITNPGALTGTQIGPYQMLEPIGKGGMGEVYKGWQTTLNRPVAIKILPSELAANPEFRARFEREARTVATLKHPNIVSVFDFGETDGRYYMVMEYVDGQELSDYIRSARRLSPREVAAIVTEIASALDYAHGQGLVHRDVKPSNIMLQKVTDVGSRGTMHRASTEIHPYRPILMDFGIAKIVGGSTGITQTGLMGTLEYVSPEQIASAKEVDGRADLYSLGVVVYQMLTGELPFIADSAARLVFAHLQQPPPDPCDLVPELPTMASLAVLKALAKKPEERFQTVGEFADEFAAAFV
jgi:protein kinase-like protein